MACDKAYERYLQSGAWAKKRAERLSIDSHKCQVCGAEAEEVHHLTYNRLGKESMDDLVSLCKKCHAKAEELYDPKIYPWAMASRTLTPNTFMAALRLDTVTLAPVVFDYLKEAGGGGNFPALMRLRQPENDESRTYWAVLQKAVDALCRKRYSKNCAFDRQSMLLQALTNRVASVGVQQIEHEVRNLTQAALCDLVHGRYKALGKWTLTAKDLGITDSTLTKLKGDNGSSFGPFLRESVMFYCAADAAAGIHPPSGFACLTEGDYKQLNAFADYMSALTDEEYLLS